MSLSVRGRPGTFEHRRFFGRSRILFSISGEFRLSTICKIPVNKLSPAKRTPYWKRQSSLLKHASSSAFKSCHQTSPQIAAAGLTARTAMAQNNWRTRPADALLLRAEVLVVGPAEAAGNCHRIISTMSSSFDRRLSPSTGKPFVKVGDSDSLKLISWRPYDGLDQGAQMSVGL